MAGSTNGKLPTDRYVIDWSDLKDSLLDGIGGKFDVFKIDANRKQAKEIAKPEKFREQWQGYEIAQVERWMREGYETPAIHGLEKIAPPIRDKRRYRLTEDGDEFLVDLALSGADRFYGEWSKRPNVPGLALDVEIGFQAGVTHKVLTPYFLWLNAVASGLENAGIDTEITLKYRADSGLFQAHRNTAYETAVRVKTEGSVQDFKSWSPMISPASFRTFVFYANCLHGEARGFALEYGMGRRNHSSFEIDFIPERQTMRISCDYNARSFPTETMTARFQAVMAEITRTV